MQLMLNATGSDMVLFVAAARTTFNLPFDGGALRLPYDVIRMDDLEWCGAYFQEQRDKLLNAETVLTCHDLDRLWLMFYATGNSSFADRVKQVVAGDALVEDDAVLLAASWSYESHQYQDDRLAPVAPPHVLQLVDEL